MRPRRRTGRNGRGTARRSGTCRTRRCADRTRRPRTRRRLPDHASRGRRRCRSPSLRGPGARSWTAWPSVALRILVSSPTMLPLPTPAWRRRRTSPTGRWRGGSRIGPSCPAPSPTGLEVRERTTRGAPVSPGTICLVLGFVASAQPPSPHGADALARKGVRPALRGPARPRFRYHLGVRPGDRIAGRAPHAEGTPRRLTLRACDL